MKDRIKKGLLDLLLLLAGTLLLAFAVKCIYEPLDMVTGGFSGLAILIKAVTEHMVPGGIPLGVSSLLLNIPVFLWAFWKKGKTFAGKSFAAMILLSLWLSILPAWNLAGEELPEPFGTIIETRIDSCHFEFSGSTHAFLLRNGEEKEGKH